MAFLALLVTQFFDNLKINLNKNTQTYISFIQE